MTLIALYGPAIVQQFSIFIIMMLKPAAYASLIEFSLSGS